MLADTQDSLEVPTTRLAGSSQTSLSHEGSPIGNSSNVSLTVNYLPTKFPNTMLAPSLSRKRKVGKGIDPVVPKRGGGVEAFRSGESRMPAGHDDDDDGVSRGLYGTEKRSKPKKLRWNRFKWILFVANILVSSSLFFIIIVFIFFRATVVLCIYAIKEFR
jgi:hypothetical protein